MRGALNRMVIAAMTLVAACGGGDVTQPVTGRVVAVTLSPLAPELTEGESTTATARAVDGVGEPVSSVSPAWSSSDETVLTVGRTGAVTAVAPGTAWVRVHYDTKGDSARVTVVRATVARVDLDVENVAIEEGATRQLVAAPRGADGRLLTGRGIQWSSSDEGVARVGALGLVTAVRPGRATITARVEGKEDAATVVVSADYDYDLVYDAWSGVAGQPPELFRASLQAPEGMPARIMPGRAATDAATSPDGRRIAFVSVVGGRRQIFVGNSDGTGVTRVTWTDTDDDQPAWNFDGTMIAFRRWDTSPVDGHSDIVVMNADGSAQRSLTADQGRTNQTDPAWSSRLVDGRSYIVYSSQTNDARGEAHLFTMRADGTEKAQLTTGAVWDDQPVFSPDGHTIAFQRHGGAIFGDLYTIGSGGGNLRALVGSTLAFGQFGPAWSPDGKLIAFASKHEGGERYQIYTVWADGSRLARRTFDATDKQRPAWIRRQP